MKSYTPGTFIVLVGTVLLILVSVSVPILKSIYFLSATAPGLDGTIKLGVWGYCVGNTCSNSTLGYTLDVDKLFGVSGVAASSGLPASLIKGLTYALILHPIAAGLGFISFLFGLISHIRELPLIGTTTSFASLAGTFGLVAFIFDIVIFEIARQRIVKAGGTATLGNAIWITLVGMLCFLFSGCFFCIGRCVVRKQRAGREASEKTRPQVDNNYSNAMRNDALGSGYGSSPMYNKDRKETGLPLFQDQAGEVIPLTALGRTVDDDEEDSYADHELARPAYGRGTPDNASLVSGVGYGYGPRTENNGIPVSLSYDPRSQPPHTPLTAGLAGAGANGRSTVKPFESMQSQPSGLDRMDSTPSRYPSGAGQYVDTTPTDEYGRQMNADDYGYAAAPAGYSDAQRDYRYVDQKPAVGGYEDTRQHQFAGPSQPDSNYYAAPPGPPPHQLANAPHDEQHYLASPTTPDGEAGALSPSAYSQRISYPAQAPSRAPTYNSHPQQHDGEFASQGYGAPRLQNRY